MSALAECFLTAKHALLQQLTADGFRYLFGNPGTTEQAFMDSLQDHPALEFILCLHEGVAVSMADTYARATRRPAFVELHVAPGFANGGGMLYNAYVGHSPLLVYTGQSSAAALFQEPLLSGDIVRMASPLSKWAHEIRSAADIPQALRRAMKTAEEPPKGPVVLVIPIDVMEQTANVIISPTTYTRWQTPPDSQAVDDAATLLAESKRPAIIVGDGVSLSDGQSDVARLAETLGAPVFQGYSSEVNISLDHPLFAGTLPIHNAQASELTRDMLAAHDVVLVLGSPVFRFIFPGAGSSLPSDVKLIQVDADGWEIGKNSLVTVGIRADCAAAAKALEYRLNGCVVDGEQRREKIVQMLKDRRHAVSVDRPAVTEGVITAETLAHQLATMLPRDAVIFDEATSASATLAQCLRPQVGHYFRARGGGLGPGMPGAVALKLARPDRPAVGIVSDGAAMYTISALWTAAHHRVAATWVICNNGEYQILKQNLADYLGPAGTTRSVLALDIDDPPIRYDRIAEGMGVWGRRVERAEDLSVALEEAFSLNAPALVDVALKSPFPR